MKGKKGKHQLCGFAGKVKNCLGRSQCDKIGAPLSQNDHCRKVKVCKVTGDRKVCARMASLGLYPGVEADIICSHKGSQCMVRINGGTISLDSQISDNIYVTDL